MAAIAAAVTGASAAARAGRRRRQMTDERALLYEVRDGIAWVTLNRSEALNALNRAVVQGLDRAWSEIDADPAVRVAVLSGAGGRAFSAGADLKERTVTDQGPADFRWAHGLRERSVRKPVIAAVDGYCFGGGFELALSCDIRIATPRAQFGLPEIRRGFFPGGGGPMRLARMIPLTNAMEMLLTGDPIDAETALRLGVISRIVPEDGLHAAAEELARRIIRNAPLAVEAVKELALRALDLPWEQVSRMSQLYRALIGTTEDAKEGPRAFVEKREPVYRGR
jgi:enoyl-CoA hydratase/carnithine racemase